MSQHRRPRTRIGRALNAWWVWPAIVGLILGYALYGASDARADGQLDRSEADYVLVYGYAVCAVIDQYPNVGGVLGVAQAIVADGFTQDSAADIINQSVLDDCPRHWPLLQAIGRVARGK
jgi:hypothetical protein